MQERGKKVDDRRNASEPADEQKRSVAKDRAARALQLAQNSAPHLRAFNANPVAYMRSLGVDGPTAKKLSLSKETLARLNSAELIRKGDGDPAPAPTPTVTICGVTVTVTATCSMTFVPTVPQDPTITATVQTACP